MKAKEFLNQYKNAMDLVYRCESEYKEAVENIDAIGSTLSGDGQPHGTGVSRKTEDKALNLVEAREKWAKAKRDAFNIRQKVVDLIIDIPDIEGEALYEKYINLLTWQEVADKLNYSLPGIHNVRQRALAIVEARLNINSRGKNNDG